MVKNIGNYQKFPYEWGYLLGVLCSDGCLLENKIVLLVKDIDFIEKFLAVLSKITKRQYNKKKRLNRRSYLWETVIRDRELCNILSKIGKYRTKNWEVPEIVLNGNNQIQRGFLNGFFDGDGSVHQGRQGRLLPVLVMSSSNQKALGQISQLLLDFGISCILMRAYNKKYQKFYYRIYIGRKEDVMAYWEKIGITMPRKKNDFIAKVKTYLKNVQYQLELKVDGFGEETQKASKFCAICGNFFIPHRSWQIYCSPECKEIGHRKTSSEYYYREKRECLKL